jgi:hypothetical protein
VSFCALGSITLAVLMPLAALQLSPTAISVIAEAIASTARPTRSQTTLEEVDAGRGAGRPEDGRDGRGRSS